MYGEHTSTEESDVEDDMKNEEDDDDNEIPTSAVSVSMSSPGNMTSPTTAHAPQYHESDMKVRLPMRQAQLDDQPQYSDNSAYYGSRNMQVSSYNIQTPNGQERRPYVPPAASYPSPQQSLYNSQWSMMSNGPSPGQSYYVTSPQQTVPPSSGTWLPPITQQQHMLPLPAVPNFQDNLSRYDTSPALGNTLRTGSMSHPHQHTQHMPPFEHPFMQDNGGFQQHENEMKVEHNQHLHHNQ
jgi:hypothetical protein